MALKHEMQLHSGVEQGAELPERSFFSISQQISAASSPISAWAVDTIPLTAKKTATNMMKDSIRAGDENMSSILVNTIIECQCILQAGTVHILPLSLNSCSCGFAFFT